jgi:pSer/pThr/pTyr-binding forkhead associated (FHA) protein
VQRTTTYPPPTSSNQLLTLGERSPLFPAVSELCGVPATNARASSLESEPSSSSTQPTPAPEPTASSSRPRAATAGNITEMPQAEGGGPSRARNDAPATAAPNDAPHGMSHQLPSIRFTAHQDPRAQRPSLVFTPQSRILPSGKETVKVGRWSERDNRVQPAANVPSAAPVGFKSKVVSRRHCEFWCSGGRWFIRDVKSSSGTFLNHIRLSSPGTESRPFPVNDGDIVQLGIDFKGGEEMIFRCVKIRVELNRGWQTTPSSFKYVSRDIRSQKWNPTNMSTY